MAKYQVRSLLWILFALLFVFTQKRDHLSDESVLLMAFTATYIFEPLWMAAVEEYQNKKKEKV